MEDYFFKDGLRFECKRCSNCCRHDPGYVFLTADDIDELSKKLGKKRDEFISAFCMEVNIGGFSRISLKEKSNNDCIMWNDGGCTVYNYRPLQCRTYPFWSSALNSPEDWKALGKTCPGVDSGKLYTSGEITEKIKLRRKKPLLEISDINENTGKK